VNAFINFCHTICGVLPPEIFKYIAHRAAARTGTILIHGYIIPLHIVYVNSIFQKNCILRPISTAYFCQFSLIDGEQDELLKNGNKFLGNSFNYYNDTFVIFSNIFSL